MKLFKHQEEALDFLSRRDQAGIFYEMGMGKCLIMLEHFKRIKPQRILIICPNSITGVWLDEAFKWDSPFSAVILQGTKKKRLELLAEDADICIINYEGLRVMKDQLLAMNFDCVVCDESLRIKNHRSQQSKIAYELGKQATYRYILTGTPVSVSPMDIWMQINFLSFKTLGRLQCFKNNYCVMKRFKFGSREVLKPVGFKNMGQLQRELKTICLRKTKKECLDLPEKIYQTIPCHMTWEQKRKYESLKKKLKIVVEEEGNAKEIRVKNAMSLFTKLHQVSQGFIFDAGHEPHYFKSAKESALEDLLENLTNKKVIVWAWYRPDVARIIKVVEKMGRRALVLDGNSEERMGIINDFQNCEDAPVFVGQIAKAGEGITLTASSYAVYYGNSWSLGQRLQSEDRNHRIGTTEAVTYYDLVTPETIDNLLFQSLKKKRGFHEMITGDTLRIASEIINQ